MWRARLITQLVAKFRYIDDDDQPVETPDEPQPDPVRRRTIQRYRWPHRMTKPKLP